MIEIEKKRLCDEFNSLKDDGEKWKWVRGHQFTGIIIYLDNDSTIGKINEESDIYFKFDDYLGYSDGIIKLLEMIGIKAQCV